MGGKSDEGKKKHGGNLKFEVRIIDQYGKEINGFVDK